MQILSKLHTVASRPSSCFCSQGFEFSIESRTQVPHQTRLHPGLESQVFKPTLGSERTFRGPLALRILFPVGPCSESLRGGQDFISVYTEQFRPAKHPLSIIISTAYTQVMHLFPVQCVSLKMIENIIVHLRGWCTGTWISSPG